MALQAAGNDSINDFTSLRSETNVINPVNNGKSNKLLCDFIVLLFFHS